MMLQQRIYLILAEYTDIICDRVRNRWDGQSAIQGNAEIDATLPMMVGGILSTTIKASGQKAWIAEMGSGSLMESSDKNPWLSEYLSSPEFNQWRMHSSRMPIMGRSAGEYRDIDGNTQVSTGAMAGLDLERDGKPEFQPMLPQHIIEREINNVIPDILAAITSAVEQELTEAFTLDVKMIL